MIKTLNIKKITVLFLFLFLAVNIFTEDDLSMEEILAQEGGTINPPDNPYEINDFLGKYKIIKVLPSLQDDVPYTESIKAFTKKYGRNGKRGKIGQEVILHKDACKIFLGWDISPTYEFGKFDRDGYLEMYDEALKRSFSACSGFYIPAKYLGYEKSSKVYALIVNRFRSFTILDEETLFIWIDSEGWILKKVK